MRKLFPLLLCLFITFNNLSYAKQIQYDHLTVKQGFPSNRVHDIAQDQQGFIWFGSIDGLIRYDGHSYLEFKHQSNNPNSISGNVIMDVIVDSKGQLWSTSYGGGVNLYQAESQQFKRFTAEPGNPNSLADNRVRNSLLDGQYIWFATEGGLSRINIEDHSIQSFPYYPAPGSAMQSTAEDTAQVLDLIDLTSDENYLWLVSSSGLVRFDRQSQQYQKITLNNLSQSTTNNSLSEIRFARNSLWLRVNGRIYRAQDHRTANSELKISAVTTDMLDPKLPRQGLTYIHGDNQNNFWFVAVDNYVYQWMADGSLSRQDAAPETSTGLLGSTVLSCFTSTNGTLWIATQRGINIKHPIKQQFNFQSYRSLLGSDDNYSKLRDTLFEDDKSFWLTTANKLYHITPEGAQYYQYTDPNTGKISGKLFTRIIRDQQGIFWLSTNGHGLFRFDPNSKQFSYFNGQQQGIKLEKILNMAITKQQKLWLAADTGLFLFDTKTQQFDPEFLNSKAFQEFNGKGIFKIALRDDDQLWLAHSSQGIWQLKNYDQWQNYKRTKQPTSLSNNAVMGLHFQDHFLWISTLNGLNRFDSKTGKARRFFVEDGLSGNILSHISHDQQNRIWVNSSDAFNLFDQNSETFQQFNADDGLQQNLLLGTVTRDHDGEIIWTGPTGINRFYPHQIKRDQTEANIVLSNLYINNKRVKVQPTTEQSNSSSILSKALDKLDRLELSHKHKQISIEFALLSFVNSQRNQYAYRLLGLDSEWVYTDSNNRRANYTGLPHGEYQLEIKASNHHGHWSQQIKRLSLVITPPWWQTKLAYFCYLLLFGTSLYAIYRMRTRQLMLRADLLQQKVSERTATIEQLIEDKDALIQQKDQMFANISHEFKTPLTLILNPLDNFNQKQTKAEMLASVPMIRRNGQRLLRMVEQLLELSKLDTIEQRSQNYQTQLNHSLALVLDSFQPVFSQQQITLLQPPFDSTLVNIKPDALESVLINLLSNAIKYSDQGSRISINVEQKEQQVTIHIEDNGHGIAEADQQRIFQRFTRSEQLHTETIPGAGIGLALVKQLLEAAGGSISLRSQLNIGSCFSVTLPRCDHSELEAEQQQSANLTGNNQTEIQVLLSERASQTQQPNSNTTSSDALDAPSDKPLVLIIDDNRDMVQLLQQSLQSQYQCLNAYDGAEGLAIAQQQLPDLVLSDVMMPKVDGYQLLEQLKSDPLTQHIPVVLLTAKSDVASRIKGWKNQADEYLSKPFHQQELLTRLDNLLSLRQLMSQRYQQQFAEQLSIGTADEQLVTQQQQQQQSSPQEQISQQFSQQLEQVLAEQHQDEELSVAKLAQGMYISQRQLNRKVRSLLGMTVVESVRLYRLKRAAELLNSGQQPSIVAYEVGFSSHSYFASCFKAHYGCQPTQYNTQSGSKTA